MCGAQRQYEMRIAIFTDSFHPELGGIQDAVAALARGLGRRGHSVLVNAPRASSGDYARTDLEERELELGENVAIRRRFSLPVPSSTRQSRLLLPTGRAARETVAFDPDVIHTHTFLGSGLEALLAAARTGRPLVGTNHWAIREFGSYVPLIPRLAGHAALSAVTSFYNRCTLVTAPSASVLDEMRGFGLRRPGEVVSNPIDVELFHPVAETEKRAYRQGFGFGHETVLYAGRLAAEKNIDVLLRALALIRVERPRATLVLAGHGSAEGPLRGLASQLGVAQSVRFLGTLDQPTLARAMLAADVFAIASTSETQSMVTLQAMAAGLPVVGARWRALPETIGSRAGLLAAPGDAEDFARKISSLLADPPMRSSMGADARLRAARSGLERIVDAWESVYCKLVADNHSTRKAPA